MSDGSRREIDDEMLRRERETNAIADARATVGYAGVGKAIESYGGCDTASAAPARDPFLNERLSLHNIEDAMTYQPWTRAQSDAGQIVKEALTFAAKAILRSCPDSAFRSVALRNIIEARMNANAAISFRGRF